MFQLINQSLLDETSAKAKQNERLRMNFNFHKQLDDPVNRLLNAMEPGTVVPIHRHLHPYKSESLVVLRGELDVLLYNDEGQLTERITLNPSKGTYGMDISGDIWHSMEAKETGTVVYEVKTGPYVPIAEEDFLHN